MKARKFSMPRRGNPDREARVDELLAVVQAFVDSGRAVPGHVLREIVQLQPHWRRRQMPAAVVEAAAVMQRVANQGLGSGGRSVAAQTHS